MLKKIAVYGLLGLVLLTGVLAAAVYAFPEAALDLALRQERKASQLAEETVEAGGFKWHVLAGGVSAADGLPLVLIHGFGGNGDHWTRVARTLTPRMRVIAPDLIGFGESDAPENGDYTIPTQVARLHALLQKLGVTRAHFGGNSMGGWVAGAYAAAYPAEVASLWMLDSAGLDTTRSEMAVAMEKGLKLPLVVRSPEEYAARMGWVFVTPPSIPAPLRSVFIARDIARADHYEAIRAQLYGVSPWLNALIPGTAAVDIPAFIVWGENDRVLHPDGATSLAGLLPKSTVKRMPGIGHCPMLENPAQSAADYLAWRDSVGL